MRERSTLITSLVLLGGLAAGSYWMAERARLSDPVARSPAHEADYFAQNFTLTRMDEHGAGLYTLTADRMTHYSDDDSTVLEKPVIVSDKPDQPTVRIRSDSGRVTSDGEEVHMIGNVDLTRAATSTDPALHARSPTMVVYPDRDIAHTDDPVDVVQGGSSLQAQSMEFDNTNRTVKFNHSSSGRGKTVLEARTARTAGAAAGTAGAVAPAPKPNR